MDDHDSHEAQGDMPVLDMMNLEDVLAELGANPAEVLARYGQCTLCGGNLHFTHFTDFATNITHEIAKCPECGIKIRQVLHKLQ